MTNEDFDALVTKTLHIGTVRLIGALHLVPQIMQHFGNAAHADATDTDEMYEANGLWHLHA
ncbi:hypothetical protein D3C73_992490 [compost metagenome]